MCGGGEKKKEHMGERGVDRFRRERKMKKVHERGKGMRRRERKKRHGRETCRE